MLLCLILTTDYKVQRPHLEESVKESFSNLLSHKVKNGALKLPRFATLLLLYVYEFRYFKSAQAIK